jgi:hypothetical protein
MTKANQAENTRSGIIPGAIVASAFFKEVEIWMNAQNEALSVMEGMMADWMRRRQEALDTWSGSLKKMCECRNPVDFIETQQDWLRDALRLAASDIRALAGDTTTLTTKVTAGFEKPVGNADDDAPQARRGKPGAGGSQLVERVAAE